MKIFHNMYIAIFVLIFSVILFGYSVYRYELAEVSSNDELKTVVIKPGSIDSIANTLYKEDLIRNKFVFKLYVKISGKSNLKAATYSFSEDMGARKIVDILYKGSGVNTEQIKITFKEGLNIRQIAKVIVENTNNTEAMVYDALKDKEYLNELIDEYWFIEDVILDDRIYYSLEGYLYPNTYYFASSDVDVKTIFKSMLDEMEKQLKDYKDKINNNDYSLHEILTLASIVESEGIIFEDRRKIAGALYNRLDRNMPFECDVTTYYGEKVNMGEKKPNELDLYECNDYNTRCVTFKQIPIGPVCNPSIDSIKATLVPDYTYVYFLADINKKIYFNKTLNEHNNTKYRLEREGLWW